MTTTPVLPGKSLGQKSLLDYSRWGCKEPDTHAHLGTTTRKWGGLEIK